MIRLCCDNEPVKAVSAATACQQAQAVSDEQTAPDASYTINYDIYGYENYGYYYGVAAEDGFRYIPYQYAPPVARKYQAPIAAPAVSQEPTLVVAPEEDPLANVVEAPPVVEAEVDGAFQAYDDYGYGYDYDDGYAYENEYESGYENGYGESSENESGYENGYDESSEYEYEYGYGDSSEFEHAVVGENEFERYAKEFERDYSDADAAPADRLSRDLSDLAEDPRHSVGQDEAKRINEENDGIADPPAQAPVVAHGQKHCEQNRCEQERCDWDAGYDDDLYWYDENSLPGYEEDYEDFDACHECDDFKVEVQKRAPAPVEDSYDHEGYEYDYEAYEYGYDCDDYRPMKVEAETKENDEPQASHDDYDYNYDGQSYDCRGDCDGYQRKVEAPAYDEEAANGLDYEDYGYDYQYEYDYGYEPYQADSEAAEAHAYATDQPAASEKVQVLVEVMAQAVEGLHAMFREMSAEANRRVESGDWQVTEPAVLVDDPAPVPPGYGLPLDGDVGL